MRLFLVFLLCALYAVQVNAMCVVIDAGHGGQDPGAVVNGIQEKTITLALAQHIRHLLEADPRYKVHLTRTEDINLTLAARVAFARTHKADVFLSLHADKVKKSTVHGLSVYTLSLEASDTQTAILAAQENDGTHSKSAEVVTQILADLTVRETQIHSHFLAQTLVTHFQDVPILDKPHRFANFAVLKAPDIPSVLVEVGFLSNITEANTLREDSYQRKVAQILKMGLDSYFLQVQEVIK